MASQIRYLAVFLMLSTSALAETSLAPSCSTVITTVAPCLSFLTDGSGPSKECCTGVQEIANDVKNKDDRTSVCRCLKQALSEIGSYDKSRIPKLPVKCGVSGLNIPPIDQHTDCSKVTTLALG